MRYAIVNGTRTEATKGAKAICPGCGSELIAKCGERKINHWAHKGTRTCDLWWEPETEWHRSWKNNYPAEWQEIILPDEKTGEKHIADVCTDDHLVIEFQHSAIDLGEQVARENFYKNMVWVVDGTRLKKDYLRFLNGRNYGLDTDKKGVFFVGSPKDTFPSAWLESSVPVIFDFKGLETVEDQDIRNHLYCLLPLRIGKSATFVEIPRKAFIRSTIDGDWSGRVYNLIENLIQEKEKQEQKYYELIPKRK